MKENFKECVSAELRSLRAKHKYTQKEVADRASVDIMTVVRYENNSTSMQLDMLEKIENNIEMNEAVYDMPIYIFFDNVSANLQN